MSAPIIIFWLSLVGIIYPYFIYPLILRVLVAILGHKPVDYPYATPTLSLMIPAHNEEAIIREKIESSLNLDYPPEKLEIIVISDGSNDRTDEILSGFNDPRLKIIFQREQMGKNRSLNRAMKSAGGEIIVFTDANAFFAPNALRELVCPFANSKIGCVVGKHNYLNTKESLIGKLESCYWNYDNLLKTWEGKLYSLLGANGPIFAIRHNLWDDVDDAVHEDFIIPIKIMKKGFYNVYRPEARAQEEAVSTVEQEFKRRTRIVWKGWVAVNQALIGFLHPFRGILIFEIISRKVTKRLIWLFGGLLFLSNLILINNNWYLYPFIAQIAFLIAGTIGRIQRNSPDKNKICYFAYSILVLIFANMVGFYFFIRGRKPRGVWEIQRP
ncbi:MAG: glycosyltransferase family 2 protein [Candidatus Auribacterota bacterium]|nr:glycosyltransferase family 2 protein [Candidatus Auribacterota bacterium]